MYTLSGCRSSLKTSEPASEPIPGFQGFSVEVASTYAALHGAGIDEDKPCCDETGCIQRWCGSPFRLLVCLHWFNLEVSIDDVDT